MNFNFGEVLSRAWQIIWKHKVLWIFGIFAGCSRGGNFNSSNNGGGNGGGFGDVNLPPQIEQFFQNAAENLTMYMVIAITLFCVIWLVMIFLGTIGRIGLIRGTWQVEGGVENLVFGELFSESMPFFWRIFGLSLLAALPILIVVVLAIVVMVPIVIASSGGGGDSAAAGALGSMTLFCGCLCLLVPVMIVIGLVVRQAENAIVLEDMGVMPSISRGWEVFRNNLGPIILMAVILGVIGMIVGFVITIPFLVIVVPAVLTFAAGQGQDMTPMILAGVCACLYIPVTWLLNGVLTAYTESAWTLTYMRLTKPQSNAPVVLEANA